jgi:predicted PurR-regulated permease PerM
LEERREGYERRAADRRSRVPGPPGPPREGERRARVIGWRNRDILRAAILVGGVYALLRLLWFAASLFFVAFLGVLFGLALSGGVDELKRIGVPRVVGAVTIVLLFIGALTGLGMLIAPTLRQQTQELRQELPAAIDRLEQWVERRQGVVGVLLGTEDDAPPAPDVEPAETLRDRIAAELGNLTRYLFPFLTSTMAVLAGVLGIVFIAIYISVQPDVYQRGVMHMVPLRSRRKAELVLRKMAMLLRRWLVTQLVAMVAVGAITTATLLVLRVPAAVALGVLAGLLEFIPIIGPVIASIPAIAMAFLDSPEKALAVTVAFIIIQQIESQLITPILMKEGLDLPPVLTLVTQSVMAVLFGFVGVVVAVPLLAAVIVPVKMLYVEDVVGDPMHLPGDAKPGRSRKRSRTERSGEGGARPDR